MSDPFSMVFVAINDLAANSSALRALVKPGNLIRLDSEQKRDPRKEEVQVADLPELVLVPYTIEPALHNTSSSSRVIMRLQWLLSTGDIRVVQPLYPVSFALVCAMTGWKATVSTLTWQGETFVKRVDVPSVSIGINDREANRGIKGWSAVWQCEIEMHFKTDLLKQFNLGT